MKARKRKFTIFSSMGLLLGSLLFVCVGTVAPVIASVLKVNESNFFFAVDQYNHTYKCFLFHDNNGTPVPGVSIAWGEGANDTPKDLIVPGTLRYNEVDYTVRAIAKHGFRYCDFETIKLPNTIEQIEEEAFAYCSNLKTFSFPYLLDKIAPSTFIDCRKLANINYLDVNGEVTFGNNSITEIGDHAFDSCVSLREFYSPKSLTYYGEACFKNCRSLVNYYFPSAKYSNQVITNPITVRPYAFADCKSLVYIYFETNVTEIDNYAFVDTNENLHIKYTGTKIPDDEFYKEGNLQTHWRDFFIASNLPDQIPVDYDHPTIYPDDTYPCLRYNIENSPVPLDSAQGRTPTVNVIDSTDLVGDDSEYAVIYKFDTPSVDVPGCFEVATGHLTIPETIAGKKVKIIKSSAFANNPYIKSITFSKNLVQICNRAFVNCEEIRSLDFNLCESLKEVSYCAFYDYDFDNVIYNNHVESLILPNCLEYIGGYAFSMFYKVKTFCLPENVKAIDDLAFFRLGFSTTEADATVNLKLPKSLNDADARAANFKHIAKEYKTNNYYSHENYTRRYAIGKYAFNEAKCLASVYMEDDPDRATDLTYTTSFYSNTFHTASRLLKFKANKNLQFLGKDAFKNCSNLREVFLTTYKSSKYTANNDKNYPWCIDEENGSYGGTLFFESLPELVCYVDGEKAPGKLSTYSLTSENTGKTQLNSMWNSETASVYINEAKQGSNLGRKIVPTYYNVNYDDVKYWDPSANDFTIAPNTITGYNNGVIAFAKNHATNKYSVTRYYCDRTADTGTGVAYIDLTSITGISDGTTNNLVEIGDECFGVNGLYDGENGSRNRTPGLYFILPETITRIGDRAFYRQTGAKGDNKTDPTTNGRFGVRIVTYKNSSGNVIDSEGNAISLSALDTIITNIQDQDDADKRGFCVLPGQITSIGKLAFYSNIFQKVIITSTLSYFGVGAFYCHTVRNEVPKGLIDSFTMTASSNFDCENNGLYFIGIEGKKILMSQANGETGTLEVASGTKAIGMMALADTLYSTIKLQGEEGGLTTIYGMGIAHNRNLTTVTGVSSLRYIGTMENYLNNNTGWSDDGYTEVWDNSVSEYFENSDYRDYAYAPRPIIDSLTSAFYGCPKLSTINFTEMTELRKIGASAFYACDALKYMAGEHTYVYKRYNASDGSLSVITGRDSDNANVLDLTYCTKLRCIDRAAFVSCPTIKYIHLPDNRNGASQSQLYIGKDQEMKTASSNILSAGSDSAYTSILVGETAFYADPNFGTSHSASSHYPKGIFGNKNRVYYYIAQKSDIPEGTSGTDLRYWTRGGDGSYILIESAKDAHKYFPN